MISIITGEIIMIVITGEIMMIARKLKLYHWGNHDDREEIKGRKYNRIKGQRSIIKKNRGVTRERTVWTGGNHGGLQSQQ